LVSAGDWSGPITRDDLDDVASCISAPSGSQAKILERLHLGQLLATSPRKLYVFLRRKTAKRFRKLAAEMYNYAAKREAIRRDLISADEEDASLRALIHIVGAEDYSAP